MEFVIWKELCKNEVALWWAVMVVTFEIKANALGEKRNSL